MTMSRQDKFTKDSNSPPAVEKTTGKDPASVETKPPENHTPQPPESNPRQAFREGLKPEPTPDVSTSPLTAPKIDKDYTTTGITKQPVQTPSASPPPPPPPPPAAKVGELPPAVEDDVTPPPATTASTVPSAPAEETAASQSFAPPTGGAQDPTKYTMPGNYALQTAKDIFNGANYALKWTVAPWLYVPQKREFIKHEKATKRIVDVTGKGTPSDIKDRVKTHNADISQKMALDGEDKELFVPAMAGWLHETGWHMSPTGRLLMASGQIAMRKMSDVGEIRRANKEFVADLQEEISQFLEIYEKEMKPMIAAIEQERSRKVMGVNINQPPAEPPKTVEPPKKDK